MIKLISLDLDGTLLNSERKLLEKNRKAIELAIENDIHVIISTGSPYNLIPHGFFESLNISYAITSNGSAIYEFKTGKCVYEESIDTDSILPILNFLLTKNAHIDIFIKGKGYCPIDKKDIIYKLDVPQSRKNYILTDRIWLDDPLSYIYEHQCSVQKITINFYPNYKGVLIDREEVKEYLVGNLMIDVVTGGWGNLEITKRGVNKGKALKSLCNLLGISLIETIAIGDSINDLDIIKTAGVGIAMENSMPEVIDAADYVTKSNDDCGVAEAIELFISKERIL